MAGDKNKNAIWALLLSFLTSITTFQQNYKKLLDEVFVISRITKVKVSVISRSRRLRLITLTETLIILDIIKTESNNCFIIHWTKKKMVTTVRGTDNLFLIVWKYLTFSQLFLFHAISKQLLCHLRRHFCVLRVLIFNYFFDVLLGQRSKLGSHVFASSLTASNTKRANLTWLPLKIMHHGHTWDDYPWPWVSLTWLLYNLQLWRLRSWFRKFTVRFRPIRNEIVSWMYNNHNNQLLATTDEMVSLPWLATKWSAAIFVWYLPNTRILLAKKAFMELGSSFSARMILALGTNTLCMKPEYRKRMALGLPAF